MHESTFLKAWSLIDPVRQIFVPSSSSYFARSDQADELVRIKGEVVQNLGSILTILRTNEIDYRREFATSKYRNSQFTSRGRVDLVGIRKQLIQSAWEFKTTIGPATIRSSQIVQLRSSFGDKLQLAGLNIDPRISGCIFKFEEMLQDLRLQGCEHNFFEDAFQQVISTKSTQAQLVSTWATLEASLDHCLFQKHPARNLLPMLAQESHREEYVHRPDFNCNLHIPCFDDAIFQTATRCHLPDINFNNATTIKFENLKGVKLRLIWSLPPDISVDSTIRRDQVFPGETVYEFLEQVLAHRSSNLNMWHLLNALNLPILQLARIQNLKVITD